VTRATISDDTLANPLASATTTAFQYYEPRAHCLVVERTIDRRSTTCS